jgi:hypothetical protein
MSHTKINPDQAIEQVLKLTKLTPEQYHQQVLEAGTAHADHVLTKMLPPELHEVKVEILEDILTLPHFNFWTHFQNVVYLKNLRLIQTFGHLSPNSDYMPDFHARVWKNQLLPHRIVAQPSCNFPRLVAALIKGYLLTYIPKREVQS